MRRWEAFDAVHVISDLHLGGLRGLEMFRSEGRLAAWIRSLAGGPERRVALVLNGDIVDFIAAYAEGTYLSPSDAGAQLELILGPGPDDGGARIARLPALRDALRAFVAAPGRSLVVVIGNHDIELALPEVRERLASLLGGPLRFAVQGEGFRCEVGGKQVYCVHGNATDRWNTVDHEGLRRVAEALERGEGDGAPGAERRIVEERWTRNFGTALVVDVLGAIRTRYPFVELLKPPGAPLFGILQALAPLLVRERLPGLLRLAPDAARSGVLGGAAARLADEASPGVPEILDVREALPPLQAAELDELEALRRGGVPPEALSDDGTLGAVDWMAMLGRQVVGADPRDALRRALRDWEARTTQRRLDQPDAILAALGPRVSRDVDVLVAGHSHAARAVRRAGWPGGLYFNSGTWIDLLRLPDEAFTGDEARDRAAFAEVHRALGSANRDALAGLLDTERIGTVVSVASGQGAVSARLGLVRASGEVETLQEHELGDAR